MTQENLEITKQILEVMQSGSGEAIAHYTAWHAKSAVSWICAGVAFFILSGAFALLGYKQHEDGFYVASVVLALLSTVTIALNVPTASEPEAYAIHQLITDVRGK